MTKANILELIQNDNWMMDILKAVRSLNLPDWYVGAGFIRSKVWDVLHDYSTRTPIPDIDVIYLDKNDFSESEMNQESTPAEDAYQQQLVAPMPEINWSVTNQARMHFFHGDAPYLSSEQALGEWVETATCVGVRLTANNELVLATPRDIKDLVSLILRPTPSFEDKLDVFNKRIESKKWLQKWPNLKVVTM